MPKRLGRLFFACPSASIVAVLTLFYPLTAVRLTLLVLAFMTLLASFDPFRSALFYDAAAVSAGQWWRPFTAWLAQLNGLHWLINQWGLVALWLLLPQRLPRSQVAGLIAIWLVTSLLLMYSSLDNYLGLSGVLYGWLLFAAWFSRFYSPAIRALFILLLSTKVLWENSPLVRGKPSWVGEWIDAEVAVASHLWGWSAGVMALLAVLFVRQWPAGRGRRG